MKSINKLAGVFAPLIFCLSFTLQGILREDYDPVKMYISALSIGKYGWIQIVNFILFGILLFIFSVSLLRDAKKSNTTMTGPILLIICSVCFFLSGPFVMDPIGTVSSNITIHGTIHGLLGGIAFLLMPIICFVFYYFMKNESNLKKFRNWTLIFGIVISLTLLLFTFATKIESLNKVLSDFQGFLQRLVLMPYMLWVCLYAFKLYSRSIKSYDSNKIPENLKNY
ncbi:MAG TPA: DUF998 domain-containing protein [Exilispira sp.]|nr:DUF998 domain-containing protein [Exilispira sp.]HPO60612.1 DUF998 domain-containing protein [Exilispira sp.]